MTDYTTLANVKQRLGITDTADDEALPIVIEAASRWIDRQCRRRFYAVSETRYYTTQDATCVFIDDVTSVSALATDDAADRTYSTVWATTDYDLMPYNAAAESVPYTWIEMAPEGDYAFPVVRKGVKLTAYFGYSALGNHPVAIEEACNLLTMRLWKRKDAIFGIAGPQALGVQIVQAKISADADIMSLLEPYRKPGYYA